ncbi:MAG: hypothetical protein GTO62_15665, partial [Planctomycetales bacterium]|nr:hypothetical protein [Planctomycetales bacterium]NIP70663.1 hypothetical protein [Planctomycetales bacterium]
MASASAGLADHRTRLPLEFSLEVLHNTPGDTHRIDCGQPEPIRTTRIQKRIYLAEVVPHPEEQWNAA